MRITQTRQIWSNADTSKKTLTQKQVETFGIEFTKINHLKIIWVIAVFACADHDLFLYVTETTKDRNAHRVIATLLYTALYSSAQHFVLSHQRRQRSHIILCRLLSIYIPLAHSKLQ